MFIAAGEPPFTPNAGGEWDVVGAVLVLGTLLILAIGYLIHAGTDHH